MLALALVPAKGKYPGKMKMQGRSQAKYSNKKKSTPCSNDSCYATHGSYSIPPSAFLFHPLPPFFILLAIFYSQSFFSSLFSSEYQKATAVIIISTFVQRLLFWWINPLSFVILGHSCSSFATFMSIGRRD